MHKKTMAKFKNLILRLIFAGVLSVILSSFDVRANVGLTQTLFTILGIVFSIAMSLLVSFNLSQILNKRIRLKIRQAISTSMRMLVIDFIVSCVIFALALIISCSPINIWHFKFDISIFGMCVISISLLYEVYNFRRIHQLNVEIEEQVLKEIASK